MPLCFLGEANKALGEECLSIEFFSRLYETAAEPDSQKKQLCTCIQLNTVWTVQRQPLPQPNMSFHEVVKVHQHI